MRNRSEEAAEPKRIQRKRSKGWRMPENAVYVGRPTKWGNPFTVSGSLTRERAVASYRRYIGMCVDFLDTHSLSELRGKDLACWCPLDQSCHADVLLRIANQSPAVREAGCANAVPTVADGENK